MSEKLDTLIEQAPDNFIIKDAISRCYEIVQLHKKIVCFYSGGADSDIMLDLLLRCGAKEKTKFVFFNTGLEYAATIAHIREVERKYGIMIEVIPPRKPIPVSIQQYGAPFWSKFVSDMIYRLQYNGFKWEDRPYEDLIKEYPTCATALKWWCNVSQGKTSQYTIQRAPYLKEFMVQNPPNFKISDKCCLYSKKIPSKEYRKDKGFDLQCLGIRLAEEGVRAGSIKHCYSESSDIDSYRPVFYFKDDDKKQYAEHYKIKFSDCYEKYGLYRTGCFGCPFGKRFEEELECIAEHEPKLFLAANKIFEKSYDYTRKYLLFREDMKNNKQT